ncbi:hypothetical protein B0T17DRAFT_65963 [Bombardia bombarda]|uniref:Uncharacterized protein n=1 Tax=Bombardia bombarda TaxID=252184 RepID=A0AA40CG18_9PEZI|nr:hypothetical protein B0T17DRAFT_65963 [Bombardia bombarda]
MLSNALVKEQPLHLIKLAKKMKNTMSVDFVHFGDLDEDNAAKFEAFNREVKSGEGSNLVTIPSSGALLSDQLIPSAILLTHALPQRWAICTPSTPQLPGPNLSQAPRPSQTPPIRIVGEHVRTVKPRGWLLLTTALPDFASVGSSQQIEPTTKVDKIDHHSRFRFYFASSDCTK